MGRVLVVDDEKRSMCELVSDGLSKRGHEVEWTTTGAEAVDFVHRSELDLVLVDMRLRGETGLQVCEQIVASRPDLPVIVMTAFGSMNAAIAAIRSGAYDFVTKPIELDQLAMIVDRGIRHRKLQEEVKQLRSTVERSQPTSELIGDSAPMKRVFELIHLVAETDASILITGESGTGKELVARAIHERSSRTGPMVALNCAAVPANLLESELFGHVRGAFTDAKASREGLFVRADNGTLFLDEIGDMPLDMQAKLLRALQEQRVRPVGGDTEIEFDTRIITATNRDIESEIEEGSFREDLYYRINVVRIAVPPLRSRGNDILLLAQGFLLRFAEKSGKAVRGIATPTAQKLLEYDWPGNVRELENSIERAVALTRFEDIVVDDLPERVQSFESDKLVIAGVDPEEMPTLADVEARYVRRVLRAVNGNKTRAARVLGLDRRTLYRRLERLEITGE